MKHILAAIACAVASSVVVAQQLSCVTTASHTEVTQSAYLEIWGRDGEYAVLDAGSSPGYAYLATRPQAFISSSMAANADASATFGYDRSLPALSSSSTTSARSSYLADDLSVNLKASGGVVTPFSSPVTALVTASRTRYSLSLGTRSSIVDDPLPGNAVTFTEPTPETHAVDLVSTLGSAVSSPPFDFAGLGSLPVHLAGPTRYDPVAMSPSALDRRTASAPSDTSLPDPLKLADFDITTEIHLLFDGVYTVNLLRGDFATQADYELASSWVDTHLRQLKHESLAPFAVTTLQVSSVPEPTSAAMGALGLTTLGLWMRRRKARRARPLSAPGTLPATSATAAAGTPAPSAGRCGSPPSRSCPAAPGTCVRRR